MTFAHAKVQLFFEWCKWEGIFFQKIRQIRNALLIQGARRNSGEV